MKASDRLRAMRIRLVQEIKAATSPVDALERFCIVLNETVKEAQKQETNDVMPLETWHEDIGDVLWWRFPINEPPYVGSPLYEDFPDYVTHWTRIPIPAIPKELVNSNEDE